MSASLQPSDRIEESKDMHVLLIEDNLAEARLLQEIFKGTIGELIKTTLETYNYRVLLANNCAREIEIYAQQHDEIDSDLLQTLAKSLTVSTAFMNNGGWIVHP